jgi:hypothetical protein
MASAVAPGVALTSAIIYWAHLQGRLDTIAGRVRSLNSELRGSVEGGARVASVQRQVAMLSRRSRVLHAGVLLAVLALVGFLGSSAVAFVTTGGREYPTLTRALFMLGLGAFGMSLLPALWEMLWAVRSLQEDIDSSKPAPASAPKQ